MAEAPEGAQQARNFRATFGALSVEDWWAHSELLTERAKQLDTWTHAHDAAHSPTEWAALLSKHMGEIAALALDPGRVERVADTDEYWREAMKRAALHLGALSWALIAALNRAILDATKTTPLRSPFDADQGPRCTRCDCVLAYGEMGGDLCRSCDARYS